MGWRVMWNLRLCSEDVWRWEARKCSLWKAIAVLWPKRGLNITECTLHPYWFWSQSAWKTHGFELLGWDLMSSVTILVSYAWPCPSFEPLLCSQAWASHLLTPGFPASCHPHWSLALPFPPGLDSLPSLCSAADIGSSLDISTDSMQECHEASLSSQWDSWLFQK